MNVHDLLYAVLVAVLLCGCVAVQKHAWRREPRTPQQAARRQAWAQVLPYPQLGVRVGLDGWVYSNATGRCLGRAAGARAAIVPRRPVHTMRPGTAWAVIYFADGETHHWMFATRNRPEAETQAAAFNGRHEQQTAALFRRTAPRPGAAARQ